METSLSGRINHPPRRHAAVVLGITLAIFGFAGPGHAAGPIIQARNYEYVAPGGGSSLTVAAGAEVTWVASGDPHTITSGAPGAIDDRFEDRAASAGFLLDGATFTTTFPTTGTYPYFCEVHFETMLGTVVVVAASTPAPTKAPTPRPTPLPTRAPTPAPPTATPVVTHSAPPAASLTSPAPRSPTPGADASPTPTRSDSPTPRASPSPSTDPRAPTSSSGAIDGPPIVFLVIVGAVILGGIMLAARRGDGLCG